MASQRRFAGLAVASAAAGLVAVSIGAGATTVPASSHPNLAGTTTITAAHSGHIRVVIPRAAYISADVKKAVTVEGGGRVVALSLVERNQSVPDVLSLLREPTQLGGTTYYDVTQAGSETQCSEVGGDPVGVTKSCYDQPTGPGRLHRGVYELRVITDAPVTITLRFTNLPGTISLDSLQPIASHITPFEITMDGSTGTAAGGTSDRASYSRSWLTFMWGKPSGELVDSGICGYNGRDGLTGSGSTRWLPHCPGADSYSYRNSTTLASPVGGFEGFGFGGGLGLSSVVPGSAGLMSTGGWLTSTSVTGFGGFTVWFQDDPASGGIQGSGGF